MSKYKHEQKLQVVNDVLQNNLSNKEAASKIGACKSDALKWVRLYQEHGEKGLSLKRGKYSGQFKNEVVEYMHKNHLSIRETATKFGIQSHSTVAGWERIYYEEGPQALFRDKRGIKKTMNYSKTMNSKLDKKTEEDLIAENQRLKMEIAYLKKLNALVQERLQRQNGKKS